MGSSMAHRAHLFSLRFASALRDRMAQGYGRRDFGRDVLAGVTVGIIAIPLSMALAIACGVPPELGLYTAFIGGFLIALAGGSRYSVSGPTAAFVVILAPIVQIYGLAGLLLATAMSGLIMIFMAYARLGRFIEFIPESVTLGFTAGIAVVIATLQLKDLLGLPTGEMPAHYIDKLILLVGSLAQFNSPALGVSVFTLFIVWLWPRWNTAIPAFLPALMCATLLGVWLNNHGYFVETINTRFSYTLSDGSIGAGIPPYLPEFQWPWQRPGAGGESMSLSWSVLVNLVPAAFAIAMLGSIESLLCAVVLDGMSGQRHSANSELLAQGLGNIVISVFAGVTATAAIARSAANFKAGASSPIAAAIHGLVVLAGLLVFSRWLSYLPMPAMAAMLLVVAWNMSEAPKAVRLIKRAPTGDVLVLVSCFVLTVMFDMIIAITAGILLASLLFMKDLAGMTKLSDITDSEAPAPRGIPDGWKIFRVNGPLFFAAADRVFSELSLKLENSPGAVISLQDVSLLDNGGISALDRLVRYCAGQGKKVYFTDLQFQPLKALARAEVRPMENVLAFSPTVNDAVEKIIASHGSDVTT